MRKFAILLVTLLLVTGAAEAATTAGPGQEPVVWP